MKISGVAIMAIGAATQVKTPPVDLVVIGTVLLVASWVMAWVAARQTGDRAVGLWVLFTSAGGYLALLSAGGALSSWFFVPAGILAVSAYLIWPIHRRRHRATRRDKDGPA